MHGHRHSHLDLAGLVPVPASFDGQVLERVPNPRPLETALKQLRHLGRELSRHARGSTGYQQTQRKVTRLQHRAADIRAHHIHALTTRLAKTHGENSSVSRFLRLP